MNLTKLSSICLIVAAVAVTGCPDNKKKTETPKKLEVTKEDHHDHGAGPNGGVVFDLGSHHAEFTVDHDKKECTIQILSMKNNEPKQVAAKDLTVHTKETKTKDGKTVPAMQIKLSAKDEKDGKASKYVGSDPGLGNVAEFEGTVIGEINGKGAEGKFKED